MPQLEHRTNVAARVGRWSAHRLKIAILGWIAFVAAAAVLGATLGTKQLDPGEQAQAIERVRSGDAVFSPRLAGFVLDAFRAGERIGGDAELDELTPREREVLQLIARGYMYKEIAVRLHLSVKTVESHVSNVLRKLQLSTRHELTRWAADRRLV